MQKKPDNQLQVSDMQSGKASAGILVGHMAMHEEFGPDNNILYIAAGDRVALVDTAERKMIASFPAEMAVAVTIGRQEAFVSDFKGHRIMVVNMATHQREAPISLDYRPLHSALSPDGRYLYVSTLGANWFSHYVLRDNGVAIIDLDQRRVTNFVALGADAVDVAVGAKGMIFATNTANDAVFAIDPRPHEIAWKSSVPKARSIAVDPADGAVYVAGKDTRDIYILNPADGALRRTLSVPGQAQRIRFTSAPIHRP